uniref:Uncharacterized protein n=1 Tax=Arundo donax TaxID=35708 RepID=A0A0A9A0I0_ARUDO
MGVLLSYEFCSGYVRDKWGSILPLVFSRDRDRQKDMFQLIVVWLFDILYC